MNKQLTIALASLALACGSPSGECAESASAGGEDTHHHHEHGDHDHGHGDHDGDHGDHQGGHDEHGDHDDHGDHGDRDHGGHGDHGHRVAHMQHDFSDVARFARMFEAPERAGWQHPVEVTRLLALAPGQTVADVGTGTGYFLPYLALAVGPTGHVLALDTEPAMVEYVRDRIAREGLAPAEARQVAPDDPHLSPGSVDAILIVDTWHHFTDRPAYATRLYQALRPGGRVLVVDFTAESPEGPPVSERVSAETVALELTGAGLTAEVLSEDLPNQYVVRGTR